MNLRQMARLAAGALLIMGACPTAGDTAFVPPASWEGRQVQAEEGPVKLFSEPGGARVARLCAAQVSGELGAVPVKPDELRRLNDYLA